MEMGDEEPLVQFVDEARNAPNALALFRSLSEVFKPALRDAYRAMPQPSWPELQPSPKP